MFEMLLIIFMCSFFGYFWGYCVGHADGCEDRKNGTS